MVDSHPNSAQDNHQLEEGLPIGKDDSVDEAIPAVQSTKQGSAVGGSRLSTISKRYDIDGDGVLNETELAMRNMDASGRGYLSNEKVYDLMNEHIKMQKDLFKFKKIVIGLAAFVVLLTLSNLGTSFAAAYLAKDTTTNKNNDLVSSDSNEAVGTQTTTDTYDTTRITETTERKLCKGSGGGAFECETNSYLKMPLKIGEALVSKCHQGKSVSLKRVWNSGHSTIIDGICPRPGEKVDYNEDITAVTFSDGLDIRPDETGSHYVVTGDIVLQDKGHECDATADCDTGLQCADDDICKTMDLDMGDACGEFDLCKTSLECYNQDTSCSSGPCGTCGCSDDTDCSGDMVCISDLTDPNGNFRVCACDTSNNGGCEGNLPVCFQAEGDQEMPQCVCGGSNDCSGSEICAQDCTDPSSSPQCTTHDFLNSLCDEVESGAVCDLDLKTCEKHTTTTTSTTTTTQDPNYTL